MRHYTTIDWGRREACHFILVFLRRPLSSSTDQPTKRVGVEGSNGCFLFPCMLAVGGDQWVCFLVFATDG